MSDEMAALGAPLSETEYYVEYENGIFTKKLDEMTKEKFGVSTPLVGVYLVKLGENLKFDDGRVYKAMLDDQETTFEFKVCAGMMLSGVKLAELYRQGCELTQLDGMINRIQGMLDEMDDKEKD